MMNSNERVPASADILVVDDNPANVDLLLDLLEDEGYECVEGLTDPLRVEPRLKQRIPDLILLDVRMPGMSGMELMERLKQQLGERMPAVIVLTAQTDEQTRYQALNLGARDFLTKPFDHVEVLKRILNTLQLQQLMTERTQRADQLEDIVADRTMALERLSRQDPVTGLPNRRALLEHLQERHTQQADTGVFFLALEGTDEIARLHGYAAADQLMLEVSQRLRTLPNTPPAFIGVWNSAEWILVYHERIDDNRAAEIARPIVQAFKTPFNVDHLAVHLRVRLGVSASMQDRTPEQLIRCAALALPALDGLWQAYSPELESALLRRTQLRDALRKAIDQDEFHLLYQPKVSLKTGKVVGAETLLRWQCPRFGYVSPVEFIPLAEASGEIVRLGEWVVRQSVQALTRWRTAGLVEDTFTLAVNVASVQLMQHDFSQRLIDMVDQSALPARVFEVEVTESGLMHDMSMAMRQLEALSKAGIRVAIDDFGTGYSSLAYLKSLPVSVLKIDRAFIRDLHQNTQDQRLTSTVIDMARHFQFMTVAEGVEQAEQLDRLIEMGCDLGQGYLFAPPLKEDALLKLAGTGFGHLASFQRMKSP